MRRRVFEILTLLSLLLCAAVCVLWVRSYRHVDLFGREGGETADRWQRGGSASSGGGLLNVEWWLRQNGPPSPLSEPAGWAYTSWPLRSRLPVHSWHGFKFEAASWDNSRPTPGRSVPRRMTYSHRVTVPHWFALLLTAAPIALRLRGWARRRRRLRENRCPACGYDLRATPGRCPECGTAVQSAPPA